MSQTQPPQVQLQFPENPLWSPGTCPFAIAITSDQGIAPTVKSTSPTTATVELDSPEGADSTYTGTITATGVGSASLFFSLEGVDYPLADVTVTLFAEAGSVSVGTPVLPQAPQAPKA